MAEVDSVLVIAFINGTLCICLKILATQETRLSADAKHAAKHFLFGLPTFKEKDTTSVGSVLAHVNTLGNEPLEVKNIHLIQKLPVSANGVKENIEPKKFTSIQLNSVLGPVKAHGWLDIPNHLQALKYQSNHFWTILALTTPSKNQCHHSLAISLSHLPDWLLNATAITGIASQRQRQEIRERING